MKKFFKNKKVFITGHTGFKGSWLTEILYSWGAIIKGYALEPKTEDDFFVVNDVENKCNTIIADINDAQKLETELLNFEPDIIFHMAAQPLVRYSYKNPLETWKTNVIGTANLLEASKQINKKCTIILITTDKVYKNFNWDYPYRETDILGGHDPYSASKAACEILIESYKKSFFSEEKLNNKQVASVRAGNVIGGGDWSEDRLVPDIVKSFLNNKTLIIRNPSAVRPWQHVMEPLAGYLELAYMLYNNSEKYEGAWNFGPYPHESIPVLDVVKTAIKILGKGDYKIESSNNSLHEPKLLKLDISKSLNNLDWHPKLNTKEAIEWTLKWYQNYLDNPNTISNLTQQMISNYFNL